MATRAIDEATARFGKLFRCIWGPLADGAEPGLATPTEHVSWTCRRVHSIGGPFHIELLEGSRGSIWATDELAAAHHLAYWSDDVAGDVRDLEARGWRLELTVMRTGGYPEEFAYLVRPGSLRVELVSSSRRAAYLEMAEPSAAYVG